MFNVTKFNRLHSIVHYPNETTPRMRRKEGIDRTTSQTTSGYLAATCNKIRAGPRGDLHPCSQFCNVFTLIPSNEAN